MSTTARAETERKIEFVTERVPAITKIETMDQQFWLLVDDNRDVAEGAVEALESNGGLDDDYAIEICHHPNTGEVMVRVVEASLKNVEREATELMNEVLDGME